jgi:hypothetical protein
MKKSGMAVLMVLTIVFAAFSGGARSQSELKIAYRGFSDAVDLNGNRLSYSFAQQTAAPQAAMLDLTAEQKRLFVEWLDKSGVFYLTAPDVLIPEPNHPGAREYFSLLVEFGEKKIDLTWRGISRWNDPARKNALDKAIEELTKLAGRLTR